MKQENMENKIEELVSLLTLEEKIGMIHGAGLFCTRGVERLSIPPLSMSDGPMGVRAEFANDEWRCTGTTDDYVTYLPCNSAVASTWNRALAKKAGEVLGEEARGRGKDVILAPGINIKRSPLCGRNFEYMSEDPYLVEELAVPMVQGIQEYDVAACVKHFAANSQETERLWVDTRVDERTLQEIYFPGFRAVVEKGGVFSLMGAYNLLNGEHCCTGRKLLNERLRKDWGYDGTVISDWGGVHDTKEAAESGLDIEMNVTYQFDQHYMADPLLKKIRSGEISESFVDDKVRNILRMMFRLHMIGETKSQRKPGVYNTKEHQEAVLAVARESVILLKNEQALLPLLHPAGKKVAVIGQNAASVHSNGGGSAEIKALYEISPLMGIKKRLGGNTEVFYAPGYYVPEKKADDGTNWQAESTKSKNPEALQEAEDIKREKRICEEEKRRRYREEAVQLAKECDMVIFVGGLTHEQDTEGADRADMELPYGQNDVIEAVLEANSDTVIVMYAGSPVEMPWKESARAILFSYYAGMEGGTAIAEVLFGDVNPSGKLAETMIKEAGQCPAHRIGSFGRKDFVEYKEGVMVGYRYYDTDRTDVNFCFGHGLSYSNFVYGNLNIEKETDDFTYTVSFTVKNNSSADGKETAQVYIAPQNAEVCRPYHELKAFSKVELKAGEEKKIKLRLDERAFSYYNVDSGGFTVQKGVYEIQVGASSRDIRLTKQIQAGL